MITHYPVRPHVVTGLIPVIPGNRLFTIPPLSNQYVHRQLHDAFCGQPARQKKVSTRHKFLGGKFNQRMARYPVGHGCRNRLIHLNGKAGQTCRQVHPASTDQDVKFCPVYVPPYCLIYPPCPWCKHSTLLHFPAPHSNGRIVPILSHQLPYGFQPTRVMGPSGTLPHEGNSDPDVQLGCRLNA